LNLSTAKKILIVRLSSLGDILLTTPLIRTLKNNFPHLEIDFLVRRKYKDLLFYNPYIKKLLIYEREDRLNDKLKKEINGNNYDLVIDLQNNFRSSKIISQLQCDKVKFNKRTIDKLLLVNFKINRLKNSPSIAERYAVTIDNLTLDGQGLDLFLPADINSRIKSEKKVIGFCPGSRHYTKMWLKDYFIELGNKLAGEGFVIALFGGKSDVNICKELSAEIKNSINLSTEDDIFQIAKDMQSCLAIVCNDSGLMHTVTTVKVPVVAIFGSTVKEFGFFPYKSKSIILENNSLSCRPCSHIGRDSCPKRHFKCMKEIIPGLVYQNLKKILDDNR
jgi:heptosyltransferase-2